MNELEHEHELSFRFANLFLVSVLVLIGGIGGSLLWLGWNFNMEITIDGYGYILPKSRQYIRSKASGLIKDILVDNGNKLSIGDSLIVLDDSELRSKLNQISTDLEINDSRIREVSWKVNQEKSLREADLIRAEMEVTRLNLELEKVMAELDIMSESTFAGTVLW